MSLILEALRKSEAERRRGEAPDLRVELPPPAATARRVPPTVWLAGGLALVLLTVAALWPRPGQDDQAEGGEGGRTGLAQAVPPGAHDGTARRQAADVAGQPGVAGAGRRSIGQDAFPRVERIEVPGGAPTPDAAPDMPLAPPPMAIRAAEEAAADAATRLPPPQPPPPAQPTRAAAPPGNTAMRIAGLSPGQRERLPEARLSLHMWNEDPARRFVVIDGQRRVEGDRLGEATVVAIDREGVLLDLDGQQVRLPLP